MELAEKAHISLVVFNNDTRLLLLVIILFVSSLKKIFFLDTGKGEREISMCGCLLRGP